MLIIGEGGHVSGDGAREAGRLEALAADLRRFGGGVAPSPEELAAAPLLEAWAVSARQVLCLVGTVKGFNRPPWNENGSDLAGLRGAGRQSRWRARGGR